MNKLVGEWATTAIAQFDAESRFRARASRGSTKHGLALLEKICFGERSHATPKVSRCPPPVAA